MICPQKLTCQTAFSFLNIFILLSDFFRQDNDIDQLLVEAVLRKPSTKYDVLVTSVNLVSLAAPVIAFIIFFHPTDPFHMILEHILELEMQLSLQIILIDLFYALAVFAMSNTFATIILMFLLANAVIQQWTDVVIPQGKLTRGKYKRFPTRSLGTLSDDKIIRVFRSSQLLCNRWHSLFGKFRVTIHFSVLHIGFITCCYLQIRYHKLFLNNNSLEIMAVIVFATIIFVLITKYECSFVGTMVDGSREFKVSCLKYANIKSCMYKTAKSFPTLITTTTYPMFTLNNESYLEFLNVSIDHIVNLLCI